MRRILFVVAAVLLFIGLVGYYHESNAQQSSDAVNALVREWNAYQNQQQHVLDAINALAKEVTELRAENAKLKADAAAKKPPPELEKKP